MKNINKFLNNKTINKLIVITGALVVTGGFVYINELSSLNNTHNQEQSIAINNNENKVMSLNDVNITKNIVDYNITAQQTNGTILTNTDSSNFPKPGDSIVSKITTKTKKDVQSEQNTKNTVLSITQNTAFKDPAQTLNARLIETKSANVNAPDPYSNFADAQTITATYNATNGRSFNLIKGPIELGGFGNTGEKIFLIGILDKDNDNKIDKEFDEDEDGVMNADVEKELSYFWQYQSQKGPVSLLWLGDYDGAHLCLTSQQLTKQELIDIANSLIKLNE